MSCTDISGLDQLPEFPQAGLTWPVRAQAAGQVYDPDDVFTPAQEAELLELSDALVAAKTAREWVIAALGIRDLLRLYKDAAHAQKFVVEHMSPSAGTTAAEKAFVAAAKKSLVGSSVSIAIDLFLKEMTVTQFGEWFGMERNIAELTADSFLAMTTSTVLIAMGYSATGVVPGLVLSAAILINDAANDVGNVRDGFHKTLFSGLETTVSMYRDGVYSAAEAQHQIGLSRQIVNNANFGGLLGSQASILVDIAEHAVVQAPLSNSLFEGRARLTARQATRLSGQDMVGYLNAIAKRLAIPGWVDEPHQVIICLNGCPAVPLPF